MSGERGEEKAVVSTILLLPVCSGVWYRGRKWASAEGVDVDGEGGWEGGRRGSEISR